MGGEAPMAGSAGISRQTENGAAEQLTEIAEFPAARESKQEMRKGLKKGGRSDTNGFGVSRKGR